MMNCKPFVVIAGPTAVGKTAISIKLAKRLDGEIISADSMQVYRRMDIGTAKIRLEEMQGIPHHLISIIEPDQEFSVSDYSRLAREQIQKIRERGKLPIIVGGTGLYINSLLHEMDFNKAEPDQDFREEMEQLRVEKGNLFLYEQLRVVSPQAASSLHPNNYKRVIRALEILRNQEDFNLFSTMKTPSTKLNYKIYILSFDREILYNRINQRVDVMIAEGLEEEVKKLMKEGFKENLPSMKGIGYRQMIAYLCGELSWEDAIEQIKRDSRRYAKRQLTWFRRYPDAVWMNPESCGADEVVNQIAMQLQLNQ